MLHPVAHETLPHGCLKRHARPYLFNYEFLTVIIKPAPSSVFSVSVNDSTLPIASAKKNMSITLDIPLSLPTSSLSTHPLGSVVKYVHFSPSYQPDSSYCHPFQDCCNGLPLTGWSGVHASLLGVNSHHGSSRDLLKTLSVYLILLLKTF